MLHPVSISGKILLSDGTTTEFSINPDQGWQQWGQSTPTLAATVDLMDALAEASGEHLREVEEPETYDWTREYDTERDHESYTEE